MKQTKPSDKRSKQKSWNGHEGVGPEIGLFVRFKDGDKPEMVTDFSYHPTDGCWVTETGRRFRLDDYNNWSIVFDGDKPKYDHERARELYKKAIDKKPLIEINAGFRTDMWGDLWEQG